MLLGQVEAVGSVFASHFTCRYLSFQLTSYLALAMRKAQGYQLAARVSKLN